MNRLVTRFSHALLFCLLIGISIQSTAIAQTPEEFATRRQRFIESLSPNTVVLLRAAPVQLRNGDVSHDYRQANSLYYLTGYPEHDAVLLLSTERNISRRSSDDPVQELLFVLPKDKTRETWDGVRFGPELAQDKFGIELVYTLDRLETVAMRLFENAETVLIDYSLLDGNKPLPEDAELLEAARERLHQFKVADAHVLLENYRLIKSPSEIALMRKAIDITSEAHRNVLKMARPGMYEYQLEAEIEKTFKELGAERNGFPSIVGSGPFSCILHYGENRRQTKAGDVIVMDIGAEYGMYSADVTRTIPISGKFSPKQRDIYQLVLDAQQASFDAIKIGGTLKDLENAVVDVLSAGLVKLGYIDNASDHKKYTLHGTSHWLGMDVHDVGMMKKLQPGMVFTVEPGIYIPELELGVRIEDDVLITEDGYEILSDSPKTIDAIEKAMRH